MAAGKSGTITATSGWVTIEVGWTETYDIASNQSVVYISYIRMKSTNWYGFTYYIDGKVRVNGTDVISMSSGAGTHHVTINGQNTFYEIAPDGGSVTTGSITIPHNSDGTKSVSFEITGNNFSRFAGYTINGNGGSGWGVSTSEVVSLTNIPRTTTPSLSASSAYMGSSVSVNFSSRASSSFSHMVEIKPATSNSWTTAISKTSNTSASFTIPDFASSIPNAVNETLYLRCTTYNGSESVGSVELAMTAMVPNTAAYYPTATITASEAQLSGYGVFIQGNSKINVSVSASGAAGSSVSSISSTFDGGTYSGASWRSAVIAGSGTLTIRTSVTDSRGRVSVITKNISVMAYSKPELSVFSVERCNISHQVDTNGEYAHIRYAYSVSLSSYGITATMSISYKLRSAQSYTSLTSGSATSVQATDYYPGVSMSNNYTYDIKLSVTDSLGNTSEKVLSLTSASVVFDVLSNGRGFSVGKTAEENDVFEVDWKVKAKDVEAANIDAASLDLTGNLSAAAGTFTSLTIGDMTITKMGFLNLIYPVGSIYMSTANVSPQSFLGGTWQSISGRFLLAADGNHAAGSTGGSETHTHTTGGHALTANEMPSHNHEIIGSFGYGGYHETTAFGGNSYEQGQGRMETQYAGGGAAHSHGDTGSGGSLPPYLSVYVWKRTA